MMGAEIETHGDLCFIYISNQVPSIHVSTQRHNLMAKKDPLERMMVALQKINKINCIKSNCTIHFDLLHAHDVSSRFNQSINPLFAHAHTCLTRNQIRDQIQGKRYEPR